MAESSHPWDGVADSLFEWMGEMETYAVEEIRGGHRDPFSAETSEKDKLDYYRRQMFKTSPSGEVLYDQPNPEGRDRILKTYGTKTYADIWQAVRPKGQKGLPSPEPIEDAMDQLMNEAPPMPEDEEVLDAGPQGPMPVPTV